MKLHLLDMNDAAKTYSLDENVVGVAVNDDAELVFTIEKSSIDNGYIITNTVNGNDWKCDTIDECIASFEKKYKVTVTQQHNKSDVKHTNERVIYTTEEGDTYTEQDFLNIAKGNKRLAKILIDLCDWQSPCTELDALIMNGEVIETKTGYRIKDDTTSMRMLSRL